MKNNLKIFFIIFSIIIIFVSCFLFIKQYKFTKVDSTQKDVVSIMDSLASIWNDDEGQLFTTTSLEESVAGIKNAVKNQIQDSDREKLGEIMEKKIIQELSNSKTEYSYEPWGVKFSYFNDANKVVDDKTQIIVLKYDEMNFLEIKKDIFKEKKFDDWLIKRFDIQKLTKENINNLVFWSNETKLDSKLNRNYYINIGRNIFYLNFYCLVDSSFCEKLEQMVKTFESVK